MRSTNNGSSFNNVWVEGEQVEGIHIWADGYKYVGSWKGGQMWNGRGYDKDGNIDSKYVHGVKQK